MVVNGKILFVVQQAKGNFDVLHFLLAGVIPECVPIFLVKAKGFRNGIGDADAVLVIFLKEARFDCRDDAVTFLEGVWDPPGESRE